MSNVHNLLNRLNNVKKTGKHSWKACCPAHNGTKQSLAIRDDNGIVLIHCFAEGCAIGDVLCTVGLSFADIMPDRIGVAKPNKKPFYASDVLQISSDEILIAYLITKKMLDRTVNFNDSQRLLKCANRLRHACEIANEGNGTQVIEANKNLRIIERTVNAE